MAASLGGKKLNLPPLPVSIFRWGKAKGETLHKSELGYQLPAISAAVPLPNSLGYLYM